MVAHVDGGVRQQGSPSPGTRDMRRQPNAGAALGRGPFAQHRGSPMVGHDARRAREDLTLLYRLEGGESAVECVDCSLDILVGVCGGKEPRASGCYSHTTLKQMRDEAPKRPSVR